MTLLGISLCCLGLVAQQAVIFTWGGAVLIGLLASRGLLQLKLHRLEASSFSMSWKSSERQVSSRRLSPLSLQFTILNHSNTDILFASLEAIGAPGLVLSMEQSSGRLPASSATRMLLNVRPERVGNLGIFRISLRVRGTSGFFEVPLSFHNPYGIKICPCARLIPRRTSGHRTETLTAQRRRSEAYRLADELALPSLREYQPGDSSSAHRLEGICVPTSASGSCSRGAPSTDDLVPCRRVN